MGLVTYDIDGNLIEVQEDGNLKTSYTYNTLGKLVKIKNKDLYERNFSYDLLGRRLEAEELHKVGTTNYKKQKYVYDDNNNLVTKTTLSGNDINYTYDELDRLTRTYSQDTNVVYTYDYFSFGI